MSAQTLQPLVDLYDATGKKIGGGRSVMALEARQARFRARGRDAGGPLGYAR